MIEQIETYIFLSFQYSTVKKLPGLALASEAMLLLETGLSYKFKRKIRRASELRWSRRCNQSRK